MKAGKNLLIFALFFVLMSVSAFAQVAITPSVANTNDDLVCSPGRSGSFIYRWTLNNGPEQNLGNTVYAYQTTRGQTWTCRIYIPPTRYAGIVKIGEVSVTVQNSNPVINSLTFSNGIEPAVITFTSSASDLDGDSLTYSWTGPFTASGTSVSNTFLQNGTYPVTLTVTDNAGGSATQTVNVVINDTVPTVNFNMPVSAVEGTSVNFTDLSAAYDMPMTYLWDFGDGQTSTSQNPANIYAQNGTYPVMLTVTDNDGSVVSLTQNITITDTDPTADAGQDQNVIEGNFVSFDGSNSTGYDQPLSYSWNWTDGTPDGTGVNPTHVFAQNGTYDVVLTVTDNDGSTATDNVLIIVNDTTPLASFSLSSNNVLVNQTIDAMDMSIAYDGISSWNWDLTNDGLTPDDITTQNATFSYAVPGNYTVNLTVTDSDGSIGSIIQNIEVRALPTVFANLTLSSIENNSVTSDIGSISFDFITNNLTTTILDIPAGTYLISFAPATEFNFSHWVVEGNASLLDNMTNPTSITLYNGNVNLTAVYFNSTNTVPPATPQSPNITYTSPAQVQNINVSNAIDFNITAEDPEGSDLNVNWTLDGANVFSEVIANGSSSNYSASFPSNGTFVVGVTVTDNQTLNTTYSWTVNVANGTIPPVNDTTAPVISNVTISGITNETAVINWTTDELADSRLSVVPALGGSSSGGTTPALVLNHSVNIGSLTANTTYNYTVSSCDASGNCNTSNTYNFTTLANGIIPPVNNAPVLTAIGNQTVVEGSPLTITLNATDLDNDTLTYGTDAVFGSLVGNVFTWTPAALDVGNHTVMFNVTDGVNPAVSETINIEVTSLPPVIVHDVLISRTYINNVNGVRLSDSLGADVAGNLTQGQSYTIGYRVDNNGTVPELTDSYITVYNSTGAVVFTNSHSNNIAAGATSAHNTDSWDTTGWNVGQYTIEVNATISADSSTANNIGSRTVNLVAPVVPNTAPATVTGVTATRTNSTITWNWTDPTDADFNHVKVFLDGTNVANVSAGTQTYTATGLENATSYTLNLHTVDSLGLENMTDVIDIQTTLQNNDVTAPTISSVLVSGITNQSAIITWNTNEQSNSRVTYNSASQSDASYVLNHSVSLTGLQANTLYNYNVTSCDGSGNCRTSTTNSFTTSVSAADNVPVIHSALANPNPINQGQRINITANVTDDNGISAVNVRINGVTYPMTLSGSVYNYEFTNTLTLFGTVQFTVNATDSIGQVTSAAGSFTVRDVTLPTVRIDNPVTRTYVTSTIPITINATDNVAVDKVWYRIDTGANVLVANGATVTSAGLTNGAHTLFAYANDTSGNGNVASIPFTVDTTGIASGTARDQSGAILPGVTVAIQGTAWSQVTNGAGTYAIAGIMPNAYIFTANKSGYLSQTRTGQVISSNATTTVDFTLVQAGTLSGTVYDFWTYPGVIQGATVSLMQGATVIDTRVTGALGTYSFVDIAPGYYDVRASAPAIPSYDGYSVQTITSNHVLAGQTTTVNFALGD